MADVVSVGMVDDHPALLLGATSMLDAEPDLQVVAAEATVNALLRRAVRLDIVLLDLLLSDGSTPAENIARLSTLNVPILAFTAGDRQDLVREAAKAGACGMVRKSESRGAITQALRTAISGEVAASADWAAALDADPGFAEAHLTPREAEVLELYASGETAERVASLLFISKETVLDHVRHIRTKYALVDRPAPTKVDLYRRAVEDRIVKH